MDDLCYIPSQTSPAEKGYFVEILRLTYECQSSFQGGSWCQNIIFILNKRYSEYFAHETETISFPLAYCITTFVLPMDECDNKVHKDRLNPWS